jgi:hypothetical protein
MLGDLGFVPARAVDIADFKREGGNVLTLDPAYDIIGNGHPALLKIDHRGGCDDRAAGSERPQ